ncbi:hypothetical protein LTR64_001997 [Lithohypha guttulata]|uniref:uncharacterized protein n=1 Tax=Lithohypha guttulata TaxID=1690604 RepID=UPI002DE02EC4|nr:hypothetical protein LTR51_007856 [Lithohypha guttulata]
MRMVQDEDNLITLTNEKEHDERRKKMAAGYSGKDNLTLERDLDDCILDLCNLIESRYAVDAAAESSQLKPMDLARKIQYFTVDVMSKVSLGLNFHDLRDDNDNFEYINEIETMFPKIFSTCCTPRVLMFLTDIRFLKLFAPQATAKLGMGKVLAITQKLVAEHFDAEKNVVVHKPDMLDSFMKHGLTQEQAEQESVLQLLAGSDTSATGMRSTMFNLISSPRAYNKLMTEVDAAIAVGKIPRDLNQVISDSAARELPYLQACIKEGLRWLPPIVGMLAKETPPQGDTIDGYFVPGGVSVAWSAKAIYQNTALFGPDPKAFRPDRWIHTSEGGDEPSRDKIAAMEKNNDLIFGNGKYTCLGKPVAMLELNKLYVELLRRFEFGLMNP